MKVQKQMVRIGSDQLHPRHIAKYDAEGKLIPAPDGVKQWKITPEMRTVAGRVSVDLGEVTVSTPETRDEVIAQLDAAPAVVIDTLSTQLVTNAANEYRRRFEKDSEAAINRIRRDVTTRWLWTAEGLPFAAGYAQVPIGNEKAKNAFLDKIFAEHTDAINAYVKSLQS